MIQRMKCFLGEHKEQWLECELRFYPQVLMKCSYCNKYNLWHTERNTDHWTRDINEFPKEVVEYIKKYKL